ncbi:MAG: hypothetical protein LBV72_06135 [Tannerella sp.]|jgi:hypothetical protein|nr:hypothetical protein [Tannerella sp.]
MKKNIFITLIAFLLCSSLNLMAQEQEKKKFDKEAYQAKRNAYITAEIGLTADEAGDFIPLDNEFRQKMFDIGRECRRLGRESRSKEKLSDDDYLKLVDCQIDTKSKEAQIEKEYFEKFKKILSPEKLFKYQQADAKFMREFMREGSRNNRHGSSDKK